MIIELDAKVHIPDFWNIDFFMSDKVEFETRPMWSDAHKSDASQGLKDWYQKYKDVGIDENNTRGIKWDFLYDNLYHTQGHKDTPTIDGFHINRWWISKIDIGCMFPYHIDAWSNRWSDHMFSRGDKDILKKISSNLVPADEEMILWIPLQNYKRGHMLVYEDTLITDYKAEKAYILPKKEHSAINMSHEPKLTLVAMVVKNED